MARWLLIICSLVLLGGCSKIPRPVDDYRADQAAKKATQLPKDPADAAVFTQLKKEGHDFSKPTEVRYHLFFPDESGARGAIHVLSSDGYTGELMQSQGEWLAILKKTIVLDADIVDMDRFKMRDLTVNAGGHYDGWSAQAQK